MNALETVDVAVIVLVMTGVDKCRLSIFGVRVVNMVGCVVHHLQWQ